MAICQEVEENFNDNDWKESPDFFKLTEGIRLRYNKKTKKTVEYDLYNDNKRLSVMLHKVYELLTWDYKYLDYISKKRGKTFEQVRSTFKNKSINIENCAAYLKFKKDESGVKRLSKANFCHARLCPMCLWRKSNKIHRTLMDVAKHMLEQGYCFIFVTLTVKNPEAEELGNTIDKMNYALDRLMKTKKIKHGWKGYFKSLEIVHGTYEKQTGKDFWHPHIHMLVAVDKDYFYSDKYISQAELTQDWKRCLDVNYTPIANIKAVYKKGATGSQKYKLTPEELSDAVSEAAKYTVKGKQLLNFKNWNYSVECVKLMEDVLHHRRLTTWGGEMDKARKQLKLSDPEKAKDLDVDENGITCDNGEKFDQEYTYVFTGAYNQYMLCNTKTVI